VKRKITVSVALAALLISSVTTGILTPSATAASRPALFRVPQPVIAGMNLQSTTIPQLQLAMNEGRLTSVQLTSFYLNRIALMNPLMHAVIETNPSALAEAAASDARRQAGQLLGPMDGIPVLLKDNIDTADLENSAAGSYALLFSHPAHDAGLVTRLREGGAIILGKANMSEWAAYRSTSGSSGWSALGGQGENPYEYGFSPCGSSSGPGAAVAAALTQVAVGTETDGSVVCPSAMNGDVGIKPSLGLVSTSGVVPISKQQDVAGPIARNVTDAAILLSVMAGPDARDPATQAAVKYAYALRDYTKLLNPDAVKGMRIGVWRDMPEEPIAPSTMAVFNHAVKELQRMGATTVPITIPHLTPVDNDEFAAIAYEFKADMNAYLAATPGVHPRNLAGLIRYNRQHAKVEMKYFGQNIWVASEATKGGLQSPVYRKLRATATSAAQLGLNQTLSKFHLDAIVCPTENSAWKIPLGTGQGDGGLFLESSTPAAVSGYADMTVPMGFVGSLPVGMSVMAGDFSESTLISIAYAFQQFTQARRPPQFLDYPGWTDAG
jgi:amidase